MRELARAVFGEIDAVVRTQSAHLAFEVRAEIRVLAGLIHEAIPHVDIDRTGLLGTRAVEIVEIDHVGGRLGAADRWQSDPEHRNTLALERRNRLVDSPPVDFRPAIGTEFDYVTGLAARLRFGREDRRLIG